MTLPMSANVMNWVSRHILLAPFMCLFLLLSCGSSHKAVKSDAEVIRKDSTSESVNIVHGSSTSLSELITANGNYVIDFRIYDTRKPPDSLTGKPPLLADGHVEGDFNKKEDKQTVVADTTSVKVDKRTTSNTREEKRSETIKERKESTLLKQIGFACVCVTVLLVVMLIVKHWRNRQSSS
nr:MAG TPA: Lysis protein [Caudoviricetes sp.]